MPTNTLSFQKYALETLIDRANFLNEKWNLGLPSPVSCSNITRFGANPKTNGMSGGVTFAGRFAFSISEGRFEKFADLHYWMSGYDTPDQNERLRALAQMTNLLTKTTALAVARHALEQLGLSERTLNMREPPEINQYTYSPLGGNKKYPLPLYHIEWTRKDHPGRSRDQWGAAIEMEISGVTSNVASFWLGPVTTNYPASVKIPIPTNYFQLLGYRRTNPLPGAR